MSRHRPTPGVVFLILVLGMLPLLSSCRSGPTRAEIIAESEEGLRAQLREFAFNFIAVTEQYARQAAAATTDIDTRRRSLYWRQRTVPACMAAISSPDVRVALFNTWILTLQLRNFFGPEGAGAETIAPEVVQVARAGNEQLVNDIEAIAQDFLPEDQWENINREVEDYAQRHPLSRSTKGMVLLASMDEKSGMWDWVSGFRVPSINPFGGINETAAAVREIAAVGDRFTNMSVLLPQRIGWQSESLFYEVEASPLIISAADSVKKVAASTEAFAQVMQTLPDQITSDIQMVSATAEKLPGDFGNEMRLTIDKAFADFDSAQGNLQTTLGEARGLTTDVDEVLASTGEVAGTFQEITHNVDEAGQSWGQTLTVLDGIINPEPDPDQAPEPPDPNAFGVEDVAPLARDVTNAAAEGRALLVEIQKLIAGDELDAVGEATDQKARGLVDYLIIRLALLIVVFFAVMFGYRLAVRKAMA